MSEESDVEEGDGETAEAPPKSGKKKFIAMLAAALMFGGGGFYATYSGLLFSSPGEEEKTAKKAPKAVAELDIAYLHLDELVVPLSPRARSNFLVFRAAVEVDAADLSTIEKLSPRILDTLNTYLRAVDETQLTEPSAMPLLRARLLRRVAASAEPVEPRDILITTFVLK